MIGCVILSLVTAALLSADGGLVVICSDCGARPIQRPTFSVGSAQPSPEGKRIIDEVARVLADHPELELVGVEGHAAAGEKDAAGLSHRRAEAVVAELVRLGVAASRLEVHGAGAARPLADNRTPVGQAANRRVELVIYRASGEERSRWKAP